MISGKLFNFWLRKSRQVFLPKFVMNPISWLCDVSCYHFAPNLLAAKQLHLLSVTCLELSGPKKLSPTNCNLDTKTNSNFSYIGTFFGRTYRWKYQHLFCPWHFGGFLLNVELRLKTAGLRKTALFPAARDRKRQLVQWYSVPQGNVIFLRERNFWLVSRLFR